MFTFKWSRAWIDFQGIDSKSLSSRHLLPTSLSARISADTSQKLAAMKLESTAMPGGKLAIVHSIQRSPFIPCERRRPKVRRCLDFHGGIVHNCRNSHDISLVVKGHNSSWILALLFVRWNSASQLTVPVGVDWGSVASLSRRVLNRLSRSNQYRCNYDAVRATDSKICQLDQTCYIKK